MRFTEVIVCEFAQFAYVGDCRSDVVNVQTISGVALTRSTSYGPMNCTLTLYSGSPSASVVLTVNNYALQGDVVNIFDGPDVSGANVLSQDASGMLEFLDRF